MGFTLNTILNYGESRDTLVAEIKAELLLRITNLLESQFFDRTQGGGLDNLENEMISEEQLIVLGTQLVTTVADYSAGVPDERKVITSQNWITIELDTSGNLVILLYFLLYTDFQSNPENIDSISKVFSL
jgi:hypothetical protein